MKEDTFKFMVTHHTGTIQKYKSDDPIVGSMVYKDSVFDTFEEAKRILIERKQIIFSGIRQVHEDTCKKFNDDLSDITHILEHHLEVEESNLGCGVSEEMFNKMWVEMEEKRQPLIDFYKKNGIIWNGHPDDNERFMNSIDSAALDWCARKTFGENIAYLDKYKYIEMEDSLVQWSLETFRANTLGDKDKDTLKPDYDKINKLWLEHKQK